VLLPPMARLMLVLACLSLVAEIGASALVSAKVAVQPPLSVAMTKLTVNRLAHALGDLASHMDVDQFALASLTDDHTEGVAAFLERRKTRFKGS
jgi:enoyl-CoA hydratase